MKALVIQYCSIGTENRGSLSDSAMELTRILILFE